MTNYEIADPAEAQRLLLQTALCARSVLPAGETVRAALRWSLEITSQGIPLPPVGIVSDIGQLAYDRNAAAVPAEDFDLLPAALTRRYEDYVLGRLYADTSFERAADALLRYQGRDRLLSLAFLVNQLAQRAALPGLLLNPATVRSLLGRGGDEILAQAWQSVAETGVDQRLESIYERAVRGFQDCGDLLGPEDIFELEHGTAIADFGQRVALRQVLQAASMLQQSLPSQKPRAGSQRHAQVATWLLDEDTYPVGGYASIATRGSIESLLHSQLAYIEPDDRPDLFDLKFLRDELFYYARDENHFYRRRRRYVVALAADLYQARFKDADLPYQRIVLLLALLVALIDKLTEWLVSEALVFDIIFLEGASSDQRLQDEQELLETLLREQIQGGMVMLRRGKGEQLPEWRQQYARRGRCDCLVVSYGPSPLAADLEGFSQLLLNAAVPSLRTTGCPRQVPDVEDSQVGWQQALRALVEAWI